MPIQYGKLAIVYHTRGELDKPEEMYSNALELHKALRSKDRLAMQYGNLGIVYQTRGELDKSEELHRKALELD